MAQVKRKREAPDGYKWVVPDGQWAWMVLAGSTLMSLCATIPQISFGVMLTQLIEKLDTDTATITWAVSIRAFISSVLGPAIAILITRVSCRKVVMAGGIGLSLAMILTSFAWRVEILWITFGIVGGISQSFIQIPHQVTLTRYFKKYYGMAVGFHSAGFAVGRTIFTPIVQLLREHYGVEGTFLIMGALSLHMTVGGSLFQPHKWHQKLVPLSEEELEKLKEKQQNNNQSMEIEESDTKARNKHRCMPTSIDMTVLRKTMFYLLIFHSVVQMTTVQYGTMFMFPFGVDIGLEAMEAAALVSTRSISEIVGRLAGPTVITTFLKKKLMVMFIFGLALNGGLLGVLSFMEPNAGLYVVAALYGVVFGAIIGLGQVVMVTIMGVERLSSVMGLKNFILSFLTFGTGPLIGWIRDVTGTYRNCYRFLSGMEIALAIVWAIGVLAKRCQRKK